MCCEGRLEMLVRAADVLEEQRNRDHSVSAAELGGEQG